MRKGKPTKANTPQKIFDVSRPGRTSASATSRPVIVGHKPQVKDPMMSERTDARPLLDSSQKVTLAVPTDAEIIASDAVQPNVPAATEQPVQPVAPELPQTQLPSQSASDLAALVTSNAVEATPPVTQNPDRSQEMPIPTPSQVQQPESPPEPPVSSPTGTTGVVFDDESPMMASTSNPQSSSAEPLPTLSDEPIDMASQAKIVVSHHDYSSGWAKFFLTFIILAVIAVIIVDLLLDSGLIVKNGIPHTHFL